MAGALAAIVLLGLGAGDRLGIFGRRPGGDLERYDGRQFVVVHVVDGDTLDIHAPDGTRSRTRIRLWGVDTPETVRPNHPVEHFGPQASDFTRRHTLDQTVTLRLEPHETRCTYGRLLAYVILPDGRNLNRLLIEEGYGYADPRFPHSLRDDFAAAQEQARREGRGLWKDATPDDLPTYLRRQTAPR